MDRTLRAALLATVIVGGGIAALGTFLGFPAGGAVTVGVIAGVLSGGLLAAAGRRAETFHPTDPNAHLADDARPDLSDDDRPDVSDDDRPRPGDDDPST